MSRAASNISATVADFSREALVRGQWEPGKRLLRVLRRYEAWSARRGPIAVLMRAWLRRRHRHWCVVCAADVPLAAKIGGGLLLPHPAGVVIHPDVVIGPNCLIFQGVTLGTGGPIPGVPRLGGHVDIGAGAKLLGGIAVGDHAKIGANAVVLCDVPVGATAVGIPARIVTGGQPMPLHDAVERKAI